MNKHTPGNWYVNGSDDVWIGDRICIYVGDENDARLIAAAPDLLKVLVMMTDRFLDTEGKYGSYEQEALDLAYAAIAKATGDKHE